MPEDPKTPEEVMTAMREQCDALLALIEKAAEMPGIPSPVKVNGIHGSVGLLRLKMSLIIHGGVL